VISSLEEFRRNLCTHLFNNEMNTYIRFETNRLYTRPISLSCVLEVLVSWSYELGLFAVNTNYSGIYTRWEESSNKRSVKFVT
jgi:hypothetical protein